MIIKKEINLISQKNQHRPIKIKLKKEDEINYIMIKKKYTFLGSFYIYIYTFLGSLYIYIYIYISKPSHPQPPNLFMVTPCAHNYFNKTILK